MAKPPPDLRGVEVVSFDLFNTLVFHREGRGRGRALREYLAAHGHALVPWEHQALYDIFDLHDSEYDPDASCEERSNYYDTLASRTLHRMGVAASLEDAKRHSSRLWEILGPAAFAVFPDVVATLCALKSAGLSVIMISNWQRGLRHLVKELGLDPHFKHVVGSADVGVAKPDARIFSKACEFIGVQPDRVLHIGDTFEDDYVGGSAAGLRTLLLERDVVGNHPDADSVSSLAQVLPLLRTKSP